MTGYNDRVQPIDATERGCYDQFAGWSSLVARWAHNPKVGGSNPPPATKTPKKRRDLRQAAECGHFFWPFYVRVLSVMNY
jgi:5-methylcytosine-specific restriction endonuclease McrA